jgi:riboflavin synthase
MFTGIVEKVGRVASIRRSPEGSVLRVRASLQGGKLQGGESISIGGVCLTAIASGRGWFDVECSPHTLRLTTLGRVRLGSLVNLERAMLPSTRMGGHLVQGHVDGTGKVIGSRRDGNSRVLGFECAKEVSDYLIPRGSVTVDGVSLTVSKLKRRSFEVTLIPHTLGITTLGRLRRGAG